MSIVIGNRQYLNEGRNKLLEGQSLSRSYNMYNFTPQGIRMESFFFSNW